MAKYSYETKLQAVHEYINGEGSYKYLEKKHNIHSCGNWFSKNIFIMYMISRRLLSIVIFQYKFLLWGLKFFEKATAKFN